MESISTNSCSECDSGDVIIAKTRKFYCRICWKYRCEFQFRKRLFELSRPPKGTVGEVFKPAEQVLICYDGSPSSVALINLVLNAFVFDKQNVSSTTKLPFPFTFAILVILESELNGSPGVEGRQKLHLQSLLKWTEYATKISSGAAFPLFVSCLEMTLVDDKKQESIENDGNKNDTPLMIKLCTPGQRESTESSSNSVMEQTMCALEIEALKLPFNEDLDHKLFQLRKSLKTKTDDKDFLNVLKKNLVFAVAEQLKVSKVLFPEDQTSLAVKMFTMMSLGRGCQIADEMSFASSIREGIVSVRPLIDVSDIDLKAYLQTLDDAYTNGIVNKGAMKRKMKVDSVERLCNDFISNLQSGYPATVSTLTRIGSKLQSTSSHTATSTSNGASCQQCYLCKRQLDSVTTSTQLESVFCYGCQHFFNDMEPETTLQFKSLLGLGNEQSR